MINLLVQNAQWEDAERQRWRQLKIRRKMIRDTSNPFDLPESRFKELYRMPQALAIELVDMLEPQLRNTRISGIPPALQVLAIIRFYAEGGYQKGVGQDVNHQISQTMVSRCLHRVTDALISFSENYIRFPRDVNARRRIQERFEMRIGFPGVVGAIDCTHIAIFTPKIHEEAYVNYKRFHSLNVQMICDMELNILNIKICPGSTNDRFIWGNSRVKGLMEEMRLNEQLVRDEGKYYLIGDGGYTLSTILLTPIPRAAPDSPEERFTNSLTHTRYKIEHLFGVLKATWRCLRRDRVLHYDPTTAGQIVRACGVLHNFLRNHRYPLPAIEPDEFERPAVGDNDPRGRDYAAGLAERSAIANQYFA